MSLFRRSILLRYMSSSIIDYIYIDGPANITAYKFQLYAKNSSNQILTGVNWYITSGGQYATINQNGLVSIYEGTLNQNIVIAAEHNRDVATKTINFSYTNQLFIESANIISGTSGNVIAKYNSNTVTPTWSITEGNNYATIDNTGAITITSSGTITVQASYNTYTTTKQIELIYDANSSTETVVDENGNTTTETQTTSIDPSTGATVTNTTTEIINSDGSTTSTTTEVVENQDGSTTTTTTTTNSDGTSSETTITVSIPDPSTGAVTTNETTTTTNTNGTTIETTEVIENQDGSSTSSSTVVTYDKNGDTIGSSENETTINADGSSESSTTNYDENGDPTTQVNNSIDVNGNIDIQNIEYDENGNPVVTGYDINTEDSSTGMKYFDGDGDGVNTDYYAFDLTHGFEMGLHFTIDFTQQPPGQSDNHHNVMAMKRQDLTPWYGFQIRQTSTNKYIQIGTQFESGNNNNVTISTTNDNKVNDSANILEYNIKIVYDPTKTTNTFILDELIGGYHIAYNDVFPDIPELKYIRVTIGYALDGNGDPFRFCNMNLFDFYIKKLHNIADPELSFTNNTISITCDTTGSSIYYKLNDNLNYTIYTTPITINKDTTIQTYSQLDDEKSNIITQSYEYDNGIALPEIEVENNTIILSCDTTGTTIYYRFNTTGYFYTYIDPIIMYEDTFIQAYAELNYERTNLVSETCLFDNGVETPVISCDGEFVTIGCNQANAEIYYKLNQTGSFVIYT